MNEEAADPVAATARAQRVLVVDDEESMRYFLTRALRRHGYDVETADNGADAVEAWRARRFDLGLLDLKMPGIDGIETLSRIRELDPEALVVLMTGHGTIGSAVEAMRHGAFDYVTKPLEVDAVLLSLERALERRATLREVRELRHLADSRELHAGLIGQSPAMRKVFQTIDLLAGSEATVLIHGESGTGKELVARAVHLQSPRSSGPFVPLNCAALPQDLLENELFGHEAGAFTGASEQKSGLLDRAHGGTLFLDEVSEISLPSQAKLARFLQEREFTPLGGTEPRKVDLRVVAATNRDIEKAVKDGAFREELFWRLNVVPVHLTPLRERKEDVPLLVHHFLERFRAEGKTSVQSLSLDASILLSNHTWPGNVRELLNTIERMAVLFADRDVLDVDSLPEELRPRGPAAGTTASDLRGLPFPQALGAFEYQYFEHLLARSEGNISQASRLSGVSRPQLHRKIKQLGIDPEQHRPPPRSDA